MRNETDVANLALTMLGKEPILSLEEQTPTAKTCAANIEQARRAQLSRSDWIFARRAQAQAAVAAPELYTGWRQYALPSNIIRLRAVSTADGTPYHPGQWVGPQYRADGDYLSVGGDTAIASYICDVVDVERWPPLFAEAVAYKLASMIAVRITGRGKDASDMMTLAEATLLRAIETDAAQERSTYAKEGDTPLGPLTQEWPVVPYDGSTFWGSST